MQDLKKRFLRLKAVLEKGTIASVVPVKIEVKKNLFGEPIKEETLKKKRPMDRVKKVQAVWRFFCEAMLASHTKMTFPEYCRGKEFAQCEHLLDFFQDLELVGRIIEMFVLDWPAVQRQWSFCAKKPAPDLSALDALKMELQGFFTERQGVCGNGRDRHSAYAKGQNYGFDAWIGH